MMLAKYVVALLLAGAGSAVAGELKGCLSPEQRRAWGGEEEFSASDTSWHDQGDGLETRSPSQPDSMPE